MIAAVSMSLPLYYATATVVYVLGIVVGIRIGRLREARDGRYRHGK